MNIIYLNISKLSNILILVLSLFFLTGCEDMVKEIDWETKNIPSKLIVEGGITNKLGLHPIKLSLSADYFNSKAEPMVSGAVVVVSTDSEEIQYIESTSNLGVYEAVEPFIGQIETNYSLKVSLDKTVDGFNNYEAKSRLIEGMRVDSMHVFLYPSFGAVDVGDEEEDDDLATQDSMIVVALLYGQEPAHIDNYYLAIVYKNGVAIEENIQDNNHFSDNDYEMNGSTYFFMMIEKSFEEGDTLGIELISITKEYDYFLTGLKGIAEPQDPFGFSGPPANTVGNISNGGLGFFNCANVAFAQAVVELYIDEN
jgi:hypothetical protein